MLNRNRAIEASQEAVERMSDAKQAIQRKASRPNAKTIHPVQLIAHHLALLHPILTYLNLPYPAASRTTQA